ncbi:MAG: PaaI family thioesterase [Paracoccaceae bacterium]
MTMAPENPDFDADVRRAFGRQGMMRTLGAEIVALEPGRCTIAAPVRDATSQQHGFAHAGLGWTIGDSAAGFAAMSLMAPSEGVLTVEMKINLLAPAAGDRLVAEGRVIRRGRRLLVVQSEVFGEDGSTRNHIATMLGTMSRAGRKS